MASLSNIASSNVASTFSNPVMQDEQNKKENEIKVQESASKAFESNVRESSKNKINLYKLEKDKEKLHLAGSVLAVIVGINAFYNPYISTAVSCMCGAGIALLYSEMEKIDSEISAAVRKGFELQEDVAQYKGSYANIVRATRQISLKEAFDIAENDPNIDYFVYMKGEQMVLEIPLNGEILIFRRGDAVFFKKEGKWLAPAPGLADTYIKK